MTSKKFKKLARANARANGTSHQSELDAIARENGHVNWGSFSATLDKQDAKSPEPTEGAITPFLAFGWQRRADTLEISITDKRIFSFYHCGDRHVIGFNGDHDAAVKFAKLLEEASNVNVTSTQDISGKTFTAYVEGDLLEMTLSTQNDPEGEKKIVLTYPKYDRLAGKPALDQDTLGQVTERVTIPDHGLVIITGGSDQHQRAAADEIISQVKNYTNLAVFEEDNLAGAISHSNGWCALWMAPNMTYYQAVDKIRQSGHVPRMLANLDLSGTQQAVINLEEYAFN